MRVGLGNREKNPSTLIGGGKKVGREGGREGGRDGGREGVSE